MGMDYDSALLAGSALVTQTGDQDLGNLEDDSELDLDAFVLAAHRDVYRRLVRRGIDPTAITNETWLLDAVAYMATHRLALAGYLDAESAETRLNTAVDQINNFVPTYATTTEIPRMAGEGVPQIGHVNEGVTFGIYPYDDKTDYFRSDLPTDLG